MLIERSKKSPSRPIIVTKIAKNFLSACFPSEMFGTSLSAALDDFSTSNSLDLLNAGAKFVLAIMLRFFRLHEVAQIETENYFQFQRVFMSDSHEKLMKILPQTLEVHKVTHEAYQKL